MSGLAGRTALITGGARRIGREIALALAERGVHCLVHYNASADEAAAVVEACRARGVRAEAIAADLTSAQSIDALAAAAAGADILVHNASSFSRLRFFEDVVEDHARLLERDLAVHVTAPYRLARRLGERMVAAGWGRIVLFGDISAGAAVYRHYAPYLVSKGAVPTLTAVLALELGERSAGVTVNAVLPGPILPPEGHAPGELEGVPDRTVLRRWIGTDEIVRTVVYLLESESVTGITVPVDGGLAIKG